MTFDHFKCKWLEPINFILIQCDDLELLHKDYIFMNERLANQTTCDYAYN